MERKVFTVGEANRILPRLIPVLESLRSSFAWLSDNPPRVPYVVEQYRVVNEGPVEPVTFRSLMSVRRCLRDVGTMGVQIKDITSGLVDFPARLDGREILLCWKLGETRVGFWHELEAGYAGRRPLPPDESEEA